MSGFGDALFIVIPLCHMISGERILTLQRNGELRKRSFHKGTTYRSLTAEELPSLEFSELSDTDPTLLEVSADLLLIPSSPRH